MSDKFDKKLSSKILPKFDGVKQWSDLLTVLKNLYDNLIKYETSDFGELTDKITLSKRLAQSLNVSLPGGVHETAIDVYDKIFQNIKKNHDGYLGEDLGLYSSGLFPFFAIASIQNKILFLDKIIKNHYLTLKQPEFDLCLPGLIVSIIPGLEEQNESLQKSIKEIFNESRNKVTDTKFFGTLWSLIIKNPKIRMSCIKYISEVTPQYKEIEDIEDINEREKLITKYYPNISILTINAFKVLIEDSDLFSQRITMDFIITKFPINNIVLQENDKISLMISALKLLIKNDYSTTRRLLAWLMGPNQEDEIEMGDPNIKYMMELLIKSIKKFLKESNNKNSLLDSLKIIDQLFKQQVKLVDYILENISIDVANSVELYSRDTLNEKDEILNKFKSFYDYDPTYMDLLWNSLGKELKSINIYSNEDKKIDDVLKILNFCLEYLELNQMERKIKFYLPIISSLLQYVSQIEFNDNNLDLINSIIVVCLKFVKFLQMGNTQEKKEEIKKNKINQNIIQFSVSKGNSLQYILRSNSQNHNLIEILLQNILLYQQTYINICKMIIDENKQKDRDTFKSNLELFKYSTELVILIQEYVTTEKIPEWLIYLEKTIFNNSNLNLSLEGIYHLLNLYMISSENNIFDSIKNFLRNEQVSENVISNTLLQKLIFQTHVSRNCLELAMARLWVLLDEQNFQKSVIDLIIKFFFADQNVFQNTISNTFAINDIDQNVNAIKKFTQFWKLTSEFYPSLVFFENGECIFKMLDFLDNDHPLLRHLSKSWLSGAKNQFRKIIDPLIMVLLDKDTSWYISFNKDLFFTKEYDNRRIIESFRKLKNIILNVPNIAVRYFIDQTVSQSLLDMDEIGKELRSVTKTITIEKYLELLVSISLRFIQGKFIESVSQSFYKENFSVNAASCEFLEVLLSLTEPKSKVMNIAKVISEPLLSILYDSLLCNDEVMQVQLINVLKVLLLNTKEEHINFKNEAIEIFNSEKLHLCILKGIQINYIFVRGYFINFVESCLPIFSSILDKDSNFSIANKLINTTTEFLVSRININTKIKKGKKNKFNSIEILDDEKFYVIKNYMKEYKDFKLMDENDINVIIKGLKNILFHYLNLGNQNVDKSPDWNEVINSINNKFLNGFSLFGFLKGSNTEVDSNSKNNNSILNNKEFISLILSTLENVFSVFCICWINDSSSYINKDFCFSAIGILSYNYNSNVNPQITTNKGLFTQINQIKKPNEQVKLNITNIMRNIFIRYPIEFMRNITSLFLNENQSHVVKDKQYKLTLIEMILDIGIPADLFLLTINKIFDDKINKYPKKSKTKIKDIYPYLLQKEQCQYEAKICQMVYAYLSYNTSIAVDKNITLIWTEMFNFINNFSDNKCISTLCWQLEILALLLIKLPIKDTGLDSSFRKKLAFTINGLLTKLVDICVLNKYESLFENDSIIITPLPPSFYEQSIQIIYPNELIQNNKSKNNEILFDSIKTLCLQIKAYVENESAINTDDFIEVYRGIGFITLKRLFYPIINSLYKQEKLTPFFDYLIRNLIAILKNRTKENQLYIDISTGFLEDLMNTAPTVTCTSSKQLITDFFLEPEFFTMSRESLRLWKNIITEFSRSYPNIINDFFDKVNTGGFFSKISDDVLIKSLRRISFIIYSCSRDFFSSKLGFLLEKVKDMITKYTDNAYFESEIFFMLRILFIRFSHESLIEMIRALWPIIFTEIVNVIKLKKKNTNLDLELSAFKLIELFSLANMDEFSLYQWIFYLDDFDVTQFNSNEQNDNKTNLSFILKNDNKIFKPFSVDYMKNLKIENDDFLNDYNNNKYDVFNQRSLLLKIREVSDKDQLIKFITKLFTYITIMNNFKNTIDLNAIEEVIENDFLNFNIKENK